MRLRRERRRRRKNGAVLNHSIQGIVCTKQEEDAINVRVYTLMVRHACNKDTKFSYKAYSIIS
jgi:hypothetical protein